MIKFYKDFFTDKGLYECLYETENYTEYKLTVKAPAKKQNRYWFIILSLVNDTITQHTNTDDIDLTFLFAEMLKQKPTMINYNEDRALDYFLSKRNHHQNALEHAKQRQAILPDTYVISEALFDVYTVMCECALNKDNLIKYLTNLSADKLRVPDVRNVELYKNTYMQECKDILTAINNNEFEFQN